MKIPNFLKLKKLEWYSLDDRIKIIEKLAVKNNYNFICHQQENAMLSFGQDGTRINVYYTKMTVATSLMHPKKGKTQLYRKMVNQIELEKIFKNPRLHTERGYYTK